MRRTFFSEKVVASRRRVISLRRGWRQVPGLSVTETGAPLTGVDLVGVDMFVVCVVLEVVNV